MPVDNRVVVEVRLEVTQAHRRVAREASLAGREAEYGAGARAGAVPRTVSRLHSKSGVCHPRHQADIHLGEGHVGAELGDVCRVGAEGRRKVAVGAAERFQDDTTLVIGDDVEKTKNPT